MSVSATCSSVARTARIASLPQITASPVTDGSPASRSRSRSSVRRSTTRSSAARSGASSNGLFR